jgi:Rap1a immunity proteins
MRGFLAGIFCLWSSICLGQSDTFSGNDVLPGCRAAADISKLMQTQDSVLLLQIGQCTGVVQTLRRLSGYDMFSSRYRLCIPLPLGDNTWQIIRVVVKYLDARPERHHEDFALLAIEAVRNAWPCEK